MYLRIFRLLSGELSKLVRQKFFYISLIVVAGMSILVSAGEHFYFIKQHELFKDNAFVIMAHTTDAGAFIALFFVMALAGTTLAEERAGRTLNYVLSRPLRRLEFLASKILLLIIYIAILLSIIGIISLIRGWMTYGLSDINTSGEHIRVGGMIGEEIGAPNLATAATSELAFTKFNMLWTFIASYLMIGSIFLAAASIGLFISAVSSTVATGIITSLAVHLVINGTRYVDSIAPYSYADYLATLSVKLSDRAEAVRSFAWTPEITTVFWGVAIYLAIFITASAVVFQRRDVTN